MERKILTAAEWARQTRAGAEPKDATILTLGEMSEVRKGADGAVVITISTPTPDRYRDVVKVEGISLAAYARNPVVLLNHDYYGMPVARAERTYIAGGALKSEPEFPAPEVYELGALVGRLVRAGFLNAASIGFRPTKSAWDEDRRGYDFLESELLEWSIVGVPANPECLVEARSAGIDLGPMRGWLERAVAVYTPELALLPKETVARALAIASGNPVTVAVKGCDDDQEKATCPSCGAEAPAGAETCPKCDKPMRAATPPDLATLSASVAQLAAQVTELSKRAVDPAPAASEKSPEKKTDPASAVTTGIPREEGLAAIKAALGTVLGKAN